MTHPTYQEIVFVSLDMIILFPYHFFQFQSSALNMSLNNMPTGLVICFPSLLQSLAQINDLDPHISIPSGFELNVRMNR